ncbi:MAG: tetraacyldisaccharide 4'-kinase [Deltaproteobacteria bacterium]|nr:tetraacyldisaccharide 4'-kinase [Deltaproteobacteria bacterium]
MKGQCIKKVEELMRKDAVTSLPHFFLYLLSLFYGAAVRLRLGLYSAGVLRTQRLPCRVVSIGNITVGGTGKTPLALLAAEILRREGKKTVILSRGYMRKTKGLVIVSDYDALLASPEEAGDEPCLMARRLPGVPVVVCHDRVKAGRAAVERFKPDFVILDDGFQHVRLGRDVNLLLVDGNEGLGNGHLLPAGILREPVSGAARADAVMIKNGGEKDAALINGFNAPSMRFTYRAAGFVNLRDGRILKTDALKAIDAVAVAGIANPAPFFKTLAALKVKVARTLVFPDHHWFTQTDMEDMLKTGAKAIVTTEKDGVRMNAAAFGKVPVYALAVDAVVEDEAAFRRILLAGC